MAQALSAPMLLAAAVLCVAGAAKLRSPSTAKGAFAALGLPAPALFVRSLAVAELAAGVSAAVDPSGPAAGAVACLYAGFAAAALLLSRRRSSCGCFGEHELPASLWQAFLSGTFALLALAALAAGAHGIGWVITRPAIEVAAILVGTAGAAYATVLTYTLLPQAWRSWSGP